MGASASITEENERASAQFSAKEVAEEVAALGDAYLPHAKQAEENGIDGAFLMQCTEENLSSLFDDLKYDDVEEWLGHRPAITDSLPMLGQVSSDQEIYTAFGHQHLGLTGGAKSGKILSDIITQNPTNLDLSPYRPDRFSAKNQPS